ncbi:MAG: PD40 domain-containing protein [Bryobacterales bacterium]|nr:PD40 domain-containing protein [Bryobacterales bacterium]
MQRRPAFLLCAVSLSAASAAVAAPVSYATQIQPILQRQCAACHQPQARQSDLSVANFADFAKGGRQGPAFVAGNPGGSLVVKYLTGAQAPRMPLGGQLTADQIELFRAWIAEGAKDDSASAPSAAPAPPSVYRAAPLVTAFAFSPDGKYAAVSGYREILLVSLADGKLAARLPGSAMRLHSLSFTPDGATLAAVGGDPAQSGEVQIWDVAARKLRHRITASTDTLFGGSISPDGKLLACGAADKSIRLYDLATGKELRKMDHHEDWVFQTTFGVDSRRLVTVGRDRSAKLIEVETGRFLENVNLLRDALTAVTRHPKRDWVAIGGADRIPYLYKMDRPRAMRIADDSTLIRKFERQDGPITALAISPDGTRLAVGAEAGDVRIYDLETGDLKAHCSGHQGGIFALQFTPDSAQLATGGFDGTLRLYDMTGKLARSLVAAPLEMAAK